MTYQRDPNERSTDYIERSDPNVGRASLILAIIFAALLGFLVFGPNWGPQSPTESQRSELPNTTPSAPSVPTPTPPKPQ